MLQSNVEAVVRKITLLIIFGFIPEMRSLKKWVVAAANWIARARATDFRVSDEDKNGVLEVLENKRQTRSH